MSLWLTPFSGIALRGVAVALLAALASQAGAADTTKTFVDPVLGVQYDYPAHFKLDPQYHGADTMIGVTDSSSGKGDISFMVLTDEPVIPRFEQAGDAERFIEALRPQLARGLRRGEWVRAGPSRLFGQPAADMVLTHQPNTLSAQRIQLRLIGTVIDGKTYLLRCSYPADVAPEYDPACELMRDSARRR